MIFETYRQAVGGLNIILIRERGTEEELKGK
jgi:hypothetical protein